MIEATRLPFQTCAHPHCDALFVRVTSQKYCSPNCRTTAGVCPDCGLLSGRPTGHPCKECDRKRAPRHREKSEDGRRLKLFGITPEQYATLRREQGDLCAICGQPERVVGRGGRIKALAIDHCHESGRVRGLLCSSCNTAIGLMNEDPHRLHAAVRYLAAR